MSEKTTFTVNDEEVVSPKTNVKVTHDVDGNVIYAVTREEAVILKDGTLLSNKLETLKSAVEMADVLQNQNKIIDGVVNSVDAKLEELSELTEDSIVFDDDLDIDPETDIEVIDYKKQLADMQNKLNTFSFSTVKHIDREKLSIPLTTLTEDVVNLKAQFIQLSSKLAQMETQLGEIADSDDIVLSMDDETSESAILVPKLSAELLKMNDNLLKYAERIGKIEALLEDKLGDTSRLQPGETVISLLLQLLNR